MFCPRCGQKIPEDSAFCFRCGYNTNELRGITQQPQARQGNQMIPLVSNQAQYPAPYFGNQSNGNHPAEDRYTQQQPDSEFSRFIDGPERPLAFYVPKLIASVMSCIGSVYLVFISYKMEVFHMIATHVKDPIPGIALLVIAALWVIGAICGFASKKKKGPASCGGICYLFAAGMAFLGTNNLNFRLLPIVIVLSVLFGIIFLISAAGGINIDLDM